jgi:hypothetical protein
MYLNRQLNIALEDQVEAVCRLTLTVDDFPTLEPPPLEIDCSSI